MSRDINHFKEFGTFTYLGAYLDDLKKLPDDIRELGLLIRKNVIHRTTLERDKNTGTNADLRFGNMDEMSPFRQADDDYLLTSSSMLAELYRLDPRGLVMDRKVSDKIVVTCRFVAVLTASILKAKGIPARVRSGFAPYFTDDGKAWDHWVNEYWSGERWVLIDVDGCLSTSDENIDPFDMPANSFIFWARAWHDIRNGWDPKRYQNAGGFYGLFPAAWALIHDFHALMHREISYLQTARTVVFALGEPWDNQEINEEIAWKIDGLAEVMLEPDKNWDKLLQYWEDSDFRMVKGWLLWF